MGMTSLPVTHGGGSPAAGGAQLNQGRASACQEAAGSPIGSGRNMPRASYAVTWAVPGWPAVVTLPHGPDLLRSGQVNAALRRALRTGASVIIADLTGMDSCSPQGVAALARMQCRALAAGVELRVAASAPRIAWTLRSSGAVRARHVYPNLSAAVTGPSGPARHNAPAASDAETEISRSMRRRALKLVPGQVAIPTQATRRPPLALVTTLHEAQDIREPSRRRPS